MKKIILSVAVATMALSTAAAALEDIKVNGQAKLWYETNNAGTTDMFSKDAGSVGELSFKVGITGKQGNVGFGATIYETTTMGLENTLVAGARDNSTEDGMFTGELYVTAPVGASTVLKIGKQELNTPFAFTEKWQSVPNTYNAAVLVNNSIQNVTLVGAFVGQVNSTNSFKVNNDGAMATLASEIYALGGMYKAGGISANLWAYDVVSTEMAYWLDASTKIAGVSVKAIAAMKDPSVSGADSGSAFAISAGTKVGSVNLMAAYSTVSDDGQAFGNYGTGHKKTKLPTMGVYTDGKYVAQSGSDAFKIKASTKVAGYGLALQYVNNSNDTAGSKLDDMNEIDLIIAKKMGDFNVKAILMNRDGYGMDGKLATQTGAQQHVRVVTSLNF